MKTKMVLTVLGLATLVVTPAFAQKSTHRAANAYASAVQPAPITRSYPYGGTDPDANIRFELNRDAATYTSGNN